MALDLKRNQLIPPGGEKQDCVGSPSILAVVTITHMIHQVQSTAAITTIVPPVERSEGFAGPIYLVADSVFSWTSSGNITTPIGTTAVAGRAYGFIYVARSSAWKPFGEDS